MSSVITDLVWDEQAMQYRMVVWFVRSGKRKMLKETAAAYFKA